MSVKPIFYGNGMVVSFPANLPYGIFIFECASLLDHCLI